ncbi:MAG: hypothetical protein V4692_02375 [Bdellovibrionota bacterium]
MKTHEVPQDQDPSYEGGKRLCYAVDESGKIVPAHSSGWSVEEVAKSLAWKAIDADLARTLKLVQEGRASHLTYFMKKRMMDTTLLSQNMGISRFRAWWHQRPRVFAKLSEAWLSKYSECLEVSVAKLKNGVGSD